MVSAQSDEDLVREVQDGNIFAFERLVKRYHVRLLRFAYRITRHKTIAEEVVQDAFFSVYTHIHTVDPTKKFSSFLYAITRNTAISALRKEPGGQVPLKDIEFTLGNSETPLDQLVRKDERKRVRTSIQSLRTVHRRVIEMYYFDELSYEAIANKLKLPMNTVRTHLRRAKRALGELLYEKH